eukprot:TRINITY_DN3746_c0_g1_i1.p1 TRINITY_DN3746_c0_g1~~TRINITY_DN3746_c0_g1_i1.p1  ORF type:complete len:250 (+),score=59.71 TRINITY_DN3746_c0_g1_i1:164-913(+)
MQNRQLPSIYTVMANPGMGYGRPEIPPFDRLYRSFTSFPQELRKSGDPNPIAYQVPSGFSSPPPFGCTVAFAPSPQNLPSLSPHIYVLPSESFVSTQQKIVSTQQIQTSHSLSYSSETLNQEWSESDEEEEDNDYDQMIEKMRRLNENWLRNYKILRRFKRKFYHTNVTRSKGEHKTLGNWVAEQRRRKKTGRLSKTQINLLTHLGFEFERNKKKKKEMVTPPSSPLSPPSSSPAHDKSTIYALLNLIS